jgi:predicted metal-dependent HD superfamily phosphohydrolase
MEFQLDYVSKFFDIHENGFEALSHAKTDFCNGLEQLLTDLGADQYMTNSISKAVYHTMVNDKTHYHTPVHVLCLLSFAEANHIDLSNVEKLAIYFHDAIYRPGTAPAVNEHASADFMKAILTGTGISQPDIEEATKIIHATARHLEDTDFGTANLVMDLDLSGFSANISPFRVQNECIEKEFCDKDKKNYGVEEVVMLTGRLKFLELLSKRKHIYKTPWFLQNCEKRARTNLKNLIIETKRRLKVIQEKLNVG